MKIKYLMPGILFFTMAHTAMAQTETVKFKAKTGILLTTGELQKALNENFKMSSPAENNDLSQPLRIAGYGVPGAKVEIHITPVSKGGSSKPVLVVAGKQSPYDVQNYTATVGSNGSWLLGEPVAVKFREGATQRRVHVFAGQSKDGLVSKRPVNREIKLEDEKLKVIAVGTVKLLTDDKVRNDFKVFTRTGGITASSNDVPIVPVSETPFGMQGTAAPGSRVIIDVHYSGTKTEYKKVVKVAGVKTYTEKKVTNIKNKKFGSFEKPVGDDGKWHVLPIDPYEPKNGDVGTELIMSVIVIDFKAMNGNKEVFRKSVTLSVVPSSNFEAFFKQW
ncbi:hypothetical protein [Niabella drilacis]|nr:hypothetical protein [Niabella drilacis]